MQLHALMKGIEYSVLSGSVEACITNLCYDSRKAGEGSAFVCLCGAVSDGHDYAAKAYAGGARVFIVSKPVDVGNDATVLCVSDTRRALAALSANFFGEPSKQLRVIGVTGTKGKTSITYMIRAIFEEAGIPCGIIGTIGTFDGKEFAPSKNTTPESYEVQRLFRQMLDNGCAYCVMEVSSQATKLDRVAYVEFDAAVFTNLSPDHIGPGEHENFDEYKRCKQMLFEHAENAYVNNDDRYAEEMMAVSRCARTYGIEKKADISARDITLLREEGILGVGFTLCTQNGEHNVKLTAPGRFSIYNALAALSVAQHVGITAETAIKALNSFHAKGRMEILQLKAPFTVIVDYAHNAVSLENVLTTLRDYDTGRIVTLFGCGGNRDRNRRFEMGAVSGKLSHATVITSDNPRNEEPMDIINDIVTGISETGGEYTVIPDRREALRWVLENALDGDIILIAGKGHENYQEIKGVRYPFDDSEILYGLARELGIETRK